jgi:hypothetical protein
VPHCDGLYNNGSNAYYERGKGKVK